MKRNESTGRYSVRKLIRFALNSDHCRAESLERLVSEDERRAEALNAVKYAIEAEHRALVRRIFDSLPNPLPTAEAIRCAFRDDPGYRLISSRNAAKVMDLIVERCRQKGWRIPDAIRELEHWPSLFVKWHWHSLDRLRLQGADSLPRQWQGRSKADVEKTCLLLKPPKRCKISRNYWFEHAPFRMMFGNETCGMSWLRECFNAARTFLLLDGERILVGVVPRSSRFCPYTLPDAQPGEPAYRLYEAADGARPVLREVPRLRIDVPVQRGLVLLFALDGRGLRGKSNLNAIYLRALFTPENIANPLVNLDRAVEFHIRKATEIPRDGRGARFRQRFTERRLFITLSLTFNAQLVATGAQPHPYGDLKAYLQKNPTARFIRVMRAPKGGYVIRLPHPSKSACDAPKCSDPISDPSQLVGTLARLVVTEDAAVLLSKDIPKRLRAALADKFAYIVFKDRSPDEPGGVRCGYQLADRLFVDEATHAVDKPIADTRPGRPRPGLEEKISLRNKGEVVPAAGKGSRQPTVPHRAAVMPDVSAPPFQTGSGCFKVEFRLSDNVPRAVECRADTRDEMFQKMRAIGIRPSRVTQLDAAPPTASVLSGADPIDERLRRLSALHARGVISEAEYATQRARILSEL